MSRLSKILAALFTLAAAACPSLAQLQPGWEMESLSPQGGGVVYDFQTGILTATNGFVIRWGTAMLTAEQVAVNQESGEAVAAGMVRIQQGEQIWVGEQIRYNFKTRRMEAEQFRTGQSPIFAGGRGLTADITNKLYTATNAFVTTDDVARPATRIRAGFIKIIPGEKVVARDAVLYVGSVPIFYFPYYSRRLDETGNHYNFLPGYRSIYGPFLLNTYTWALNNQVDGELQADWRQKRGFGGGADVNLHGRRWGEATFQYYYLHDEDPTAYVEDPNITANRDRFYFTYLASPWTNFSARSQVRYESDAYVMKEFFEDQYRRNSQPSTFVELNKYWKTWSLDLYTQARVNDFQETVERLPEVRLTGFRQPIGSLPVYYESESSAGYYRRLFPETNAPLNLDYEAARADTFHQISSPQTLFGWLNLNPNAGARFTYYGTASGPGGLTDEEYRGVFNAGMEASFKASRVWPAAKNNFLQVDGLRHILQPSANYIYVPEPNVEPNEVPQFDFDRPTLRLLPIDFPDYNNIDSIDSQSTVRLGIHNRLQTKRAGEIANLVDWDLYTDWRLDPNEGQTQFSDVYSDLVFRPRSWLGIESLMRYDTDAGTLRMAYTGAMIQPNSVWHWALGYWYLQEDYGPPATAPGEGVNLFVSRMYYKLDENWGFQFRHQFNLDEGRLEEQSYSVYRDLRSWTAALAFRLRDDPSGGQDFTVAFTFSLKAYPRYGMGADSLKSYLLLGR